MRSSNRPFATTGELEGIGEAEAVAEIATGREKISQRILERAAKITPQFGIELVDVRFKRINYTESVQQAVFQRMIAERKRIAVERNCARVEWAVLDWNRPAIDFYLALGAVAMSEWTTYRLTEEAIARLAGGQGKSVEEVG